MQGFMERLAPDAVEGLVPQDLTAQQTERLCAACAEGGAVLATLRQAVSARPGDDAPVEAPSAQTQDLLDWLVWALACSPRLHEGAGLERVFPAWKAAAACRTLRSPPAEMGPFPDTPEGLAELAAAGMAPASLDLTAGDRVAWVHRETCLLLAALVVGRRVTPLAQGQIVTQALLHEWVQRAQGRARWVPPESVLGPEVLERARLWLQAAAVARAAENELGTCARGLAIACMLPLGMRLAAQASGAGGRVLRSLDLASLANELLLPEEASRVSEEAAREPGDPRTTSLTLDAWHLAVWAYEVDAQAAASAASGLRGEARRVHAKEHQLRQPPFVARCVVAAATVDTAWAALVARRDGLSPRDPLVVQLGSRWVVQARDVYVLCASAAQAVAVWAEAAAVEGAVSIAGARIEAPWR